MRRFRRPDVWFVLMLVILAGVGAYLLAQPDATDPDSRHLSYWRHYWQAAFDALSAACGVGLLTYDFLIDYTPRGRLILTLVGLVGALLYVGAGTQAARRMQADDDAVRVPHPLAAVGLFLLVQGVLVGAYVLLQPLLSEPAEQADNAARAVAACSSLGWASLSASAVDVHLLTAIAWIAALGWPVWLMLIPPLARRFVPRRATAVLLTGYVILLVLAGLLLTAFESPRAPVRQQPTTDTVVRAPTLTTRCVNGIEQVAAAASAGMPAHELVERDASSGTKVILAGVMLLGGMGLSATGGVQWTLMLWALAGAFAGLARTRRGPLAPDYARWMHAGLACVVLMILLAVVVALGLMFLEQITASAYQSAPTFADTLLDACSVVAGGNLSSGVIENVTGRNLIRGMGQTANLYQYGMIWLMLAMMAGRLIPLMVMRRLADTHEAWRSHRKSAVV